MKLRLTKCSQYKKDAILWQVSPLEKNSDLPDKFYLILSYHKEGGQYLRFVRERPTLVFEAGGAFSSLVRKYLNSAVLSEILLDSKNIWLPLHSAGETWFVHVHHEGAVEISLISPESMNLVRLGSKGIFTKKKEASEIPSRESVSEGLDEFLMELRRDPRALSIRLPGDDGREESAEHPSEKDQSPISHFQREVRRRIARRLKTVRQAHEKLLKGQDSDESIAELESQARTLQTYLYKVLPEMEELFLSKEETGLSEDMNISLRGDWSGVDNLSDYFKRLKKMKKGRTALADQFSKVGLELSALEFENQRLQSVSLSEEELTKILKRFRLPLDNLNLLKVMRAKVLVRIKFSRARALKF
jgi:hypothetical protein